MISRKVEPRRRSPSTTTPVCYPDDEITKQSMHRAGILICVSWSRCRNLKSCSELLGLAQPCTSIDHAGASQEMTMLFYEAVQEQEAQVYE